MTEKENGREQDKISKQIYDQEVAEQKRVSDMLNSARLRINELITVKEPRKKEKE